MKILITNDDGINATGIYILLETLIKYFTKFEDTIIKVVAPSLEMSAVSHKLTLREGLFIKKEKDLIEGIETYSVTGTPADCVKVAFDHLKYDADIVFSGVNKGFNVGNDILYSGTIAAGFEANLNKKLAITMSCDNNTFEGTKNITKVLEFLETKKELLENNICVININLPVNGKNIVFTKQGRLPFDSQYYLKEDGLYYLEGTPAPNQPENDIYTDVYNVYNNNISISFLTSDRTDYQMLAKFNK